MRIVVMGAGAIGTWLGAALSRAGHEVTLVSRRVDHVAAVNARGARVTGKSEFVAHQRAVLAAKDAPRTPDLLVFTVKSFDTARAVAEAAPLLGARTRVLSFQNGLGNAEILSRSAPPRSVLVGVTTNGVTFVEPGHVAHAGLGYTKIGPTGDDVVAAFTEAGIETALTADIEGEVWAKVVVNAGINPVTAITGLANGALLENAFLRETMERACEEAIAVAKAEGVELPADDLVARARRVAELTAKNKSSMLQDIERGRRTEIDSITGEVVRRGAERGVETPVNATLLALVRGIELTTRRA